MNANTVNSIPLLKIELFSMLVLRVDGNVLELHKVKKSEAGSYLCIASNGHPPTVSRRVQLDVKCEYNISNIAI